MNIVLTFMTTLASGYWHIFDPQNDYTAIKAGVLRTLVFYAMHKGYFFENDMLIQLNLHGVRVKDFTLLPLFLVIKFEGNNLISNINGTYRI